MDLLLGKTFPHFFFSEFFNSIHRVIHNEHRFFSLFSTFFCIF